MEYDYKIATITSHVKLDTVIDTNKLKEYMTIHQLYQNTSTKPRKQFRNQFTTTIPIMDEWIKTGGKIHNVSLKIFNNGRLHMTGCNSDSMIKAIISKAIALIIVSNSVGLPNFTVHKHEVLMINTSFDVGKKLCLHTLWMKLLKEYNLCSTYDLKVYVGINSKYISSSGDQVTMLIFNSGKVILTGPKNIESINEAFKFIKSIV